MNDPLSIPRYALFGETSAFPDVLHIERFKDRAAGYEWVINPHRHDEIHQFFMMIDGKSRTRIDDRLIPFSAGEFLYIPARIVHEFAFEPGSDGFVLSFPAPLLAELARASSDIRAALTQPLHGRTPDGLTAQLTALQQTHRSTSRFRPQKLASLAQLVLIAIAEQAEQSTGANAAKLTRLNALISEHLHESWQVKDYAAALAITAGQLSRITRAAAGTGAQAYIESQIMAEAARMLAFTQIPVAEVGFQTGFQDPAYFARRFRKHHDASPTDYRRRYFSR